MNTQQRIAPIETAVAEIAAGKMVILVDDEDRENEGDLVIAAERVTPQAVAFMARHGRGLVCLAMHPALIDRIELPPMAPQNEARLGTAFTVSIDAVDAPGAGISAKARAHTILRALAPDATAKDFRSPGHIYPLRARLGGVLVRSGQTEGSVDLARLAGLAPAGVICEVMGDDGEMSRLPALLEFGARYGISVVTVADLIEYRLQREPVVVREAESTLSTEFGTFRIVIFRSLVDGGTHAALVCGDIGGEEPVLVRVHRGNPLGDVFGFTLSRGKRSLTASLRRIAQEGRGALVYLEAERDGGDLADVLGTYIERTKGRAWPPSAPAGAKMDFQEFGIGAQILRALGLRRLRVMTNQPRRLRAVSGFGLEIAAWEPVPEELES